MTFNPNQEQYKGSIWNPFVPTKRDIERTNKLANKYLILAGALGFIFPVGAIIYLNRGENYLKLLAYLIIISFTIAIIFAIYIVINKDKGYEEIRQFSQVCKKMIDFVTLLFRISVTIESIRAVALARQRKSEPDF